MTPTSRWEASRWGVPGVLCRTTTASTPMASRFLAVSINDSPLDKLLVEAEKSITSAPRRRAAKEKLVFVRVEFSKNRFTIAAPDRTSIFSRHPCVASLHMTAVSRIRLISSAESSSKSSKWRCVQPVGGRFPRRTTGATVDDFDCDMKRALHNS